MNAQKLEAFTYAQTPCVRLQDEHANPAAIFETACVAAAQGSWMETKVEEVAVPARSAISRGPGHSQWLLKQFAQLRALGRDLAGEARFVDALIAPRSRVLDAGCGFGRVGSALVERGHHVTGVEADPILIAAGRREHPDIPWIHGELTELGTLLRDAPLYDAAVLAANVMPHLTAGTETAVLRQIVAHLQPGAPVAAGFSTVLGYSLRDFDRDSAAAGLVVEHRFGSWDMEPWTGTSPYAVTVLRR